MSQTPKKTPAKGKGRNQTAVKGCCCKRSQCIKNYCDCYQSMMVCTELCRCVGCRNTEERMAVEPRTASRNAVKKDRAAAMSAKAAAAAAATNATAVAALKTKGGTNIPVPVTIVPVPQPTVMAPINIVRVAPDTFNVVHQPVSTEELMPLEAKKADEVPTTSDEAKDMQSPEVEAKVMEPPDTELNETHNLFTPVINEAMLMCSLIQGTEAEELGLDPCQVSQLAIAEFTKCFKEVCEKMLNN